MFEVLFQAGTHHKQDLRVKQDLNGSCDLGVYGDPMREVLFGVWKQDFKVGLVVDSLFSAG